MAHDDEGKGFSASAVIFSFFVGGLVGASLAALLTPKSGDEMRERIRQLAGSARDRADSLSDELKGKASHLVDKGKEYVEQKKHILSSAIEAGKEAMEREKARLMAEAENTESETPGVGGTD